MHFLLLSTSGKASGSDLVGCYSTNNASCTDSSLCTKQQQGIQKQHSGNSLKRKKTDEAEMVETFANLQSGVWKGKKSRAVIAVVSIKKKKKGIILSGMFHSERNTALCVFIKSELWPTCSVGMTR